MFFGGTTLARTQAADYDRRRDEIVSKAARLYAEHGFLGASVSDLAAACDVSKSAIYHYYVSKEDILFDVMRAHIAALEDAAAEAIATSSNPEAQLRALAHGFMSIYGADADRHTVLLNDLDHLPAAKRDEIVRIQRGLIGTMEGILTALEPGLKDRPGAPRAAAMLFYGMINWTHTWFNQNGVVTTCMLADMAADMTLGGLAAVAGRAA